MKEDAELEQFRKLMPAPDHWDEGFGVKAMIGALFVGLIESFGSFWASAFKEVIVFTLIIPVLLWRSFQHGHGDDEE